MPRTPCWSCWCDVTNRPDDVPHTMTFCILPPTLPLSRQEFMFEMSLWRTDVRHCVPGVATHFNNHWTNQPNSDQRTPHSVVSTIHFKTRNFLISKSCWAALPYTILTNIDFDIISCKKSILDEFAQSLLRSFTERKQVLSCKTKTCLTIYYYNQLVFNEAVQLSRFFSIRTTKSL